MNPDEGRLKTGEQETPSSAPRDQPAPPKTARTGEDGVEEEEEELVGRRLEDEYEEASGEEHLLFDEESESVREPPLSPSSLC